MEQIPNREESTGESKHDYIPIKKLHTINGKTFVVISDGVLQELGIREGTFVEQVAVDDGILLKIRRF